MENNVLKAITFCYTQDNIPYQKVIGIFDRKGLDEAMATIQQAMQDMGHRVTKISLPNDSDVDNYFIKYDSGDYFYSGDYELNKIVGF